MKKALFHLLFIIISIYAYAGSGAADTLSHTREISIMTYNVKMLPRLAFTLHHHPVIRARIIPSKLMEENPDVIVIQEGFDGYAIRTLRHCLKKAYPYTAGFKNHIVFTYRRAGGVLMFSKYPMKELESIKYSQCKGIDCIGHKGCLLVEIDHPVMKFQLLGTHMQAGGSPDLKLSQYTEAGQLLKRHQVAGEPQFAAGDFNTRKSSTDLYPALVKALDAEDGVLTGELQASSDHLLNDMYNYKPDKRNLIDFIFFRANGVKPITYTRYVRQLQQQWSGSHKDLSDHFPVILRMQL